MNLRSRTNLVQKLIDDKAYRDAYVAEHVKNGVAFQLRSIRDQFGWSQAQMGEAVGKPQNVISRLENPDYGRPNIQTLLEIAAGLDIGLLVKFIPFSKLLVEYEDVSPAALSAQNIVNEREILNQWATQEKSNVAVTTAQTVVFSPTRRGILPGLQDIPLLPGLREALTSLATASTYESGQTVEVSDSVSVRRNDIATGGQIDKVTQLAAFKAVRAKNALGKDEVFPEATGTRG